MKICPRCRSGGSSLMWIPAPGRVGCDCGWIGGPEELRSDDDPRLDNFEPRVLRCEECCRAKVLASQRKVPAVVGLAADGFGWIVGLLLVLLCSPFALVGLACNRLFGPVSKDTPT